MYSSLDGAKKCAKTLCRLLDGSGFIYRLSSCQAAIAKAGGYRDWRDLEGALGSGRRPTDLDAFQRRLPRLLPNACGPVVQAWLDHSLDGDKSLDPDAPPRWYLHALLFVLVTAALHRSRTPALRRGSGPGQELRENLVVGLLLNHRGLARAAPRVDPKTLSIVFKGEPASLFGEDFRHPRFEIELAALTEAGIIEAREGKISVSSPDPDLVVARVADHMAGRALVGIGAVAKDSAGTLLDALVTIGVRNAARVADAIAQQGSKAFITPSGAVLDLLSELAEDGDIETFAKTYHLFATILPMNAAYVRRSVPAKVSSRYLARHRALSASRIMTYAAKNPEWAESLKRTVAEPALFARTVEDMADAISRAA
ncbi:hypothetical protein GCM10008171_28900 [Methylopila jiangsuensis]|uniref:Uncharacterized protein n=1 Tax=Methylopila jiangsuensis TaxID=586230 RepID=A0A9W6N4V4_9HYPH|nr:hypothetical protein [Methylopila jiangsuensis]MDR6284976.1 hypothetical protein [Methylopila jiangsuensis]GLK77636.1 hypothetical protein GCM10008171_28900 [Methylopila jiangsuensis]